MQNPMDQVVSLFQQLGQNFQQTFGMGQQQQPGYLVGSSASAGGVAAPSGGNILLDLVNRARLMNGTALVTAVQGRMDQMGENNVVITRLSNLLSGLNRTRRQTDADTAATDEAKPDEAVTTKPSETIDDVVKRLKEERELSGASPIVPRAPGPNPLPRAIDGVAQIPNNLFQGLDGLLGVGSMSGQGMSSVLDSFTRMIANAGGNVTIARAESHSSDYTRPENRGRSLWDRFESRFEERRQRLEERRRAWDDRVRERMVRLRNGSTGRVHEDSVIKPQPMDAEAAADAVDHLV